MTPHDSGGGSRLPDFGDILFNKKQTTPITTPTKKRRLYGYGRDGGGRDGGDTTTAYGRGGGGRLRIISTFEKTDNCRKDVIRYSNNCNHISFISVSTTKNEGAEGLSTREGAEGLSTRPPPTTPPRKTAATTTTTSSTTGSFCYPTLVGALIVINTISPTTSTN